MSLTKGKYINKIYMTKEYIFVNLSLGSSMPTHKFAYVSNKWKYIFLKKTGS